MACYTCTWHLCQETDLIQTPNLIFARYCPTAGYLLYDQAACASSSEVREHMPLYENITPEKMANSCSTCKFSLLHTTAKFGCSVHSSVLYPQDAFSRRAWGIVHDPLGDISCSFCKTCVGHEPSIFPRRKGLRYSVIELRNWCCFYAWYTFFTDLSLKICVLLFIVPLSVEVRSNIFIAL